VYCGQTITGWSWDFGDGSVSTSQHPLHEYINADSFLVKLTITTSNGSSGSRTTRIGIKNAKYSTELPAQAEVCAGQSVQLDAGVADAEYTWMPSFGVSETNIRNPSVQPLISTWYSVKVRKCMVDVIDSVYIIVDSIAKPQITQNENNLQVNEAYGYEWYRDGHKLGGANKRTLRVDKQGYYAVKIFNKSGCERLSDPKFFLPKSGKERDDDKLIIKCSPNPTHGLINIVLSELPEKPARIIVYDSHGGVIHKTSIQDHVNQLQMPKLKAGLYFIEVSINNKKRMMPVIVQ
jgi:PKD repeat protein